MCSSREFIFMLTFAMCFTAKILQEDFSEDSSMFVTQEECAVDTFPVEQYKNYPTLTEPYGSKGSFLMINKTGCMITRPLALEPGSQFIMIYLSVVPGIELKIVIGDKTFKPDLTFTSWGNFIQKIDSVTNYTQVKIMAQLFQGKPLLIIDNFRITPPFRTSTKSSPATTPTTVKKSTKAVANYTSEPSLIDIFAAKSTENTRQASQTFRSLGHNVVFAKSKKLRVLPEKPGVEFKLRKDSDIKDSTFVDESDRTHSNSQEYKEGAEEIAPREKPGFLTRVEQKSTSPKAHPDLVFIDTRTGTSVTFWTFLAVVSLLLSMLLVALVILVNIYLVRRNCV